MKANGSGSPAISVGIPVYNGANYVAEAIASILGQSYQDFELLIQDNASTDQTGEICREFARQDRRVSYVRNADMDQDGIDDIGLWVPRALLQVGGA